MKTTHTYLNSTYFNPLYLARLQGFRPEAEAEDAAESRVQPHRAMAGFMPFMSGVWLWLRICVYVLTGRGAPFESDIQVGEARPRYNRARRHQAQHFAKRAKARPARHIAPYYLFGPRRVSAAQFMERRCRLSCWSRASIYGMIYYAHRQVREALWARFARGDFRAPQGLCQAHLWPD